MAEDNKIKKEPNATEKKEKHKATPTKKREKKEEIEELLLEIDEGKKKSATKKLAEEKLKKEQKNKEAKEKLKKDFEKEEIEELVVDTKKRQEDIKKTTKENIKLDQTQADLELTKELDKALKELKEIEKKENIKEETEEVAKKKKKKSKKKKLSTPIKILSLIIGTLYIIGMITIFSIITYLNILPTKYYLPFTVIMIIFTLVIGFMLLNLKVKKGIKSIFLFLGTIITAICFLGSHYAFKTFDFYKEISNADLRTKEKYYIMVSKDSKYQSLEEIKDFSLATFNENTNVYKDAINKLTKKIDVTLVETKSSIETIEWLLKDEISVILLSNLHKEQYEEDNGSLENKVKILDTIEVVSDHKETEVVAIKPVSDDVMTIYISGIDTYGTINLRSRSDVNMLATINTKNHEILLTSIPRDYYVQLHDKPGYKDKLTHAGIYGVNTSIQTIQDFMGIEINYYVRVNFSTLEQVVDSIGGIDVYSDKSFRPHTNKSLYIKEGMVHMDGKTALAFARERYAYESGDRHRVQNQQDVLKAIIKKASSDPTILSKYTTLLNNISGYFQTNVDMAELSEIVKIQLDKMPSWEIKQYSLDGTGGKGPTYSMGNTELYVMIPKQETIDIGSKYINGMAKGKTFTELGLN